VPYDAQSLRLGQMRAVTPVPNGAKKRPWAAPRRVRCPAAIIALLAIFALLLGCETTWAANPQVILLRGWFGVFSTGLDEIAAQLKHLGIDAEVAGHVSWSSEVSAILRDRSAGRTDPLVLVGHSQGANNVIDMARALEPSRVNVDLLVTLSSVMQNRVPANVIKAINYYQAPGWGQAIEADPGFHGKLVNVNLANDPTVTHITIDKNSKVQAQIIQEIMALR
jgi:hypothetical protein